MVDNFPTSVSPVFIPHFRSIGGGGNTFSDGQRAGKAKGHSDAINGTPSDASCGSGHSNSYCLGYKLGYNLEYQVTRFAQD